MKQKPFINFIQNPETGNNLNGFYKNLVNFKDFKAN